MSRQDKIVNKAELLNRVADLRRRGGRVVHCHGCFDIVHPGHIRHLEFARRQGDLLVVSLTGDLQITKDTQRPYIPEELRAENLAALEMVDLVYVDPHPTACDLLSELQPDIYVKGREYEQSREPAFEAERAIITAYGGRVLFSSGDVVFSSTRLLGTIQEDGGLEAERLRLQCRRYQINHQTLESLLAAFKGLRVLVVGDLIMDRYVSCDATELASEAPMMSLSRLGEQTYVGGAGIVARHIAGLGARTHLLSAVGSDKGSAEAGLLLQEEGVDALLLDCRPTLPERTRFLVDTSKLFRVEDGASHPMDSAAVNRAAGWFESVADDVDAMVFCDFGHGTINGPLLRQLMEIAHRRDILITGDVSGSRGQLLQLHEASLLTPTERELRSALHDFERGLSRVAWGAMNRAHTQHMMVTLGKKGVVIFDRQTQDRADPAWGGRLRSEYLPSLASTVVDPLGAGDALLAASSLSLAAGGNLMQSAYLGSAAAALEVGQLGNIPIHAQILGQWLGERGELSRSLDDENTRPARIGPHDRERERERRSTSSLGNAVDPSMFSPTV